MNKEAEVAESRVVCCCGAKTWSLVLGWLQTIVNFIWIIGFGVLAYLGRAHFDIDNLRSESHRVDYASMIALFVFLSVAFLVEFVGGIMLLVGVYKKNAKKVNVWLVIKIIGLTLMVAALVSGIVSGGDVKYVWQVIYIACSIFTLWVVNVHRRELVTIKEDPGQSNWEL